MTPSTKRRAKIFISGAITNVPNYKEHFDKAQALIENEGYIPLNPTIIPLGLTIQEYMKIDLAMVDCADAVLMLKGWENSKGANLEWNYAKYMNKLIIYEQGDKNS